MASSLPHDLTAALRAALALPSQAAGPFPGPAVKQGDFPGERKQNDGLQPSCCRGHFRSEWLAQPHGSLPWIDKGPLLWQEVHLPTKGAKSPEGSLGPREGGTQASGWKLDKVWRNGAPGHRETVAGTLSGDNPQQFLWR